MSALQLHSYANGSRQWDEFLKAVPEKLMARASICQYKAGSTICLGESPVKYVHLILTSTVSAQNVTYCPRPAHSDDEAVMTIHEMKSRDGNVYTILTSVSEMGHSAYPDSAQRMWAFFRQFSRNSDGSLAVNPLPLASDVSANAWYADAVRHVLDNGMMTVNGTFSPNAPLTAGDLAQALYIRAGSPTEGFASWTKAAGIPTGSAAVTRDELAKAIRACAASRARPGQTRRMPADSRTGTLPLGTHCGPPPTGSFPARKRAGWMPPLRLHGLREPRPLHGSASSWHNSQNGGAR